MKNLNYLNKYRRELGGDRGDKFNGAFDVSLSEKPSFVIAGRGFSWEHISISHVANIMPTYDVMLELKDMFFEDNEIVMQIHPAKKDYVNNHNRCLHIWKPIDQKIPNPFKDIKKGLLSNISSKKFSIINDLSYQITVYASQEWEVISILSDNGYADWDTVCSIKNEYFGEDETIIQLHMPKNVEKELNPNAIYLWKPLKKEIPLPPKKMV